MIFRTTQFSLSDTTTVRKNRKHTVVFIQFLLRQEIFLDVDFCLFTHVNSPKHLIFGLKLKT